MTRADFAPVLIPAKGYEPAPVEELALLLEMPHVPLIACHRLVGLVAPARLDALSPLVNESTKALSFVSTDCTPMIMS